MGEAGVFVAAYGVGAGDAGAGDVEDVAGLVGVLAGGQLAGCLAGGAGVDARADEVAGGVAQLEHLAHVEVGGGAAHLGLIGVVFDAHAEDGEGEVVYLLAFVAQVAALVLGARLAPLGVEVDGVVDAGDVDEALLLGGAGLVLIGYPREVGGVDAENFVQVVAVVLAEGDEVVAFALHATGVVVDDVEGADGVEAEGAGGAQALLHVGVEVADEEDVLAAGQRGVDPEGVVGASGTGEDDEVGACFLIAATALVVGVQLAVEAVLLRRRGVGYDEVCHGCAYFLQI